MGVAKSMADIWDDDFDADNESDLVRQLRKVIKDGKAKNEQLSAEIGTLRPAVRKTQLADTLSKLGIKNPKIAGLVPADIEPTEDSVKAWVDEYGDIFGVSAAGAVNEVSEGNSAPSEPVGESSVEDDQAAQWQRIQSQQSQSGATTPDAESAQLAMLQSAAKAANGNTDDYFAFLRGEKAIPTS